MLERDWGVGQAVVWQELTTEGLTMVAVDRSLAAAQFFGDRPSVLAVPGLDELERT